MKVKANVIILRAAGTNCDYETEAAFIKAGAATDLVHINQLVRGEKRLSDYQILAIPGGFTYGDDIAAGKILANELKYNLGEEIERFVQEGKLIIGICNGFQVLVKTGLLPGSPEAAGQQEATLTFNDSGKFEDRWVYLKPDSSQRCVFTRGLDGLLYLPIAHAEGKFVTKDDSTLRRVETRGQVVFRYVTPDGQPGDYPWNPNGSVGSIAGICDPSGRIFGLMPHPERHIDPLQHPRWTREKIKGKGDGAAIFENGVRYAEKELL
ncbi:MAG TPA: phosphoribosylformylglycinamidine synthase I [Candidatus Latescibacteria bacterium]|nr:phosphoribosylformylglycinamidine synthase I [Candidatus Latescibacterota bacterium]